MWMAIIPFVLIPVTVFVAALCAGAAALRYLAKRTKFSQTQTPIGELIHVESPVATLDVHC
jgi:hypothetical protein